MISPHYEIVSQRYDDNRNVHGMICHMGDFIAARYGDISLNEELVRKMIELFNLCQLPPDRLQRVIIDLLP